MFKSIENADQDDFFDFLRIDDNPLATGYDWKMKPSEMKTGLASDPLLHPFAGAGPENKKETDTFS